MMRGPDASLFQPVKRRFYKLQSFPFLGATTQKVSLPFGLADKFGTPWVRDPEAQELHAIVEAVSPITLKFGQSVSGGNGL
jgi:Holliday junction resolvasome RuvABC ATP-dependent DNA helicase subunit